MYLPQTFIKISLIQRIWFTTLTSSLKRLFMKQKVQKKVDLYDMVAQKFIAKSIVGKSNISVPKSASVLIVEIPSASKISTSNGKTLANGVVIDYNL